MSCQIRYLVRFMLPCGGNVTMEETTEILLPDGGVALVLAYNPET